MSETQPTRRICPICREPLGDDAYWELMPPIAGHRPAWRMRHPRPGKRACVFYTGGPEKDNTEYERTVA